MPTYVTLYKWTAQGVKDVKGVPARFAAFKKLAEAAGCKTTGLYITMGEYDVVAITEVPSDELAAAAALTVASKGNTTSTTMRAFTESEFAQILDRVV